MGTSTDAILFYGYAWNDEMSPLWEGDEDEYDWEERYARLHGRDPSVYKEILELLKTEPCKIGRHCSSDCRMPFVAIKSTEIRAWRGSPVKVDLPQVDPMWNEQLLTFCQFMGIDVSKMQPGWYLVSWWS